ncbi:MAG: DUF1697 domain-containing protein [Solobacterium sp.]|nr:DUF1697 domain-containing protein [Solobacterium sp.]
MTKYAAFLRGINISGRNKISMKDLKCFFIDLGFSDVSTVLNSGNVCFKSDCLDGKELSSQIRKRIQEETGAMIPVYVIETESLNRILEHAPVWWGTDDKGIYDNLVFILTEETPEEICAQIGEPSDGWEQISLFEDVIFWSFDLKYYQKCNWWKKTATNGIAEKLTIRTANTVRKVCG